jgi:nucleoside-diphosphate-sugar epimerase
MKVLVFGGRGFIGQHLCRLLLDRRCRVVSYDRRYECPAIIGDPLNAIDRVKGDIKDREAVFEAVNQCDRWINLAGLLGTSEMIERASDAVAVNVQGALNVYDAARMFGKPGVQITVGNHWMNNPYSITKSTAERFALMYNKELGTDIRVVRAMNVYGPGQKPSPVKKFFPNAVLSALHNYPIKVYGNGLQQMDFIYVKDAAKILVDFVLEDGVDNSKVYDCGSGESTKIVDTAREIIRIADSQSTIELVPMRPGEPAWAKVVADEAPLGLTDREVAFKETIEWYRKNWL